MIEVNNLTKYYGQKRALHNISFKVKAGEILGFLGPNGAGKTTTMNIITGYLSSTKGTVTVDGQEILKNPIAVKSRIGYLPEHPPLYLDMTVDEYLGFLFELKKLTGDREAQIAEVCARVRVADVRGRLIKNLSKGYRQRVGLAQALLGDPPVLILDEPTVGLDPRQIIDIRNLIKDLGKRHTVILSSHILSEVQATCERIIVIARGELVADDTPDRLARSMSEDHSLVARIDGPRNDVLRALRRLPDVRQVRAVRAGDEDAWDYTIDPVEDRDIRRDVFTALARGNWPLLGLRSNELTLEEVFLRLVAGESDARDGDGTDVEEAADGERDGPDGVEDAAGGKTGPDTKKDAAGVQNGPGDGKDGDRQHHGPDGTGAPAAQESGPDGKEDTDGRESGPDAGQGQIGAESASSGGDASGKPRGPGAGSGGRSASGTADQKKPERGASGKRGRTGKRRRGGAHS